MNRNRTLLLAASAVIATPARAFAVGQGINKIVSYKKQAGLGTPASGAGGTQVRRTSATLTLAKDSYENNEIVGHQQSTGSTYGISRSSGTLAALLSGTSWTPFIGSLLRKDPAATAAMSGLSLTIAVSGANYSITRAAGSWLTDGLKVGDIVQLSGGGLAANNVAKNAVVVSITSATVMAVNVLATGLTMTAEGPIAASTVTVMGKKVWTPLTGHTNDFYTIEEWFPDVVRSHTWPDVQIGTLDIGMPATGNVTASFGLVGLGGKTEGPAQILTAPAAAPTTQVFGAVAGAAYINGVRYNNLTSFSLKIDASVAPGEAVIGSNSTPDVQRGRIKVSGSFTYLYDSDAIGANFLNETVVSLVFAVADARIAGANTLGFVMPQAKLFSNDPDDGEKQIVRTVNFTAEIPATGGAALANHQAILSVQDSLAA
jgi:hypothetical protein